MKRERGEAEDKERDKPCFMKRLNLLKYNPKELVGGPTLFDYPFTISASSCLMLCLCLCTQTTLSFSLYHIC